MPLLPLGPATLARLSCEALVEHAADPDLTTDPEPTTEPEPTTGPEPTSDPERGDDLEHSDVADHIVRRHLPTGHRVEHRFATAPQRRALLRRDGGCSFPGCPRRRGLHAHHLVPWSHGGPTTLANMVLLCEHHHLLVHEGGWQLTAAGTRSGWTAIGPDGRRFSPAPTTSGDPTGSQRHHEAVIAPQTITGTWAGEPLDLAYAVAVLT